MSRKTKVDSVSERGSSNKKTGGNRLKYLFSYLIVSSFYTDQPIVTG